MGDERLASAENATAYFEEAKTSTSERCLPNTIQAINPVAVKLSCKAFDRAMFSIEGQMGTDGVRLFAFFRFVSVLVLCAWMSE
tara:strand:- start:185 stop:436 length:252 start_codon:yes stop_codon:yes gene_type:complete